MQTRSESNQGQRVALVTYTRQYPAGDVLPALLRNGLSTTERPYDPTTAQLVPAIRPAIVLLAISPAQEQDRRIIRQIRETTDGYILVLGPGTHSHGFAEALHAGADVCLRDSDGPAPIGAQVEALLRRVRTSNSGESIEALTVGDLTIDLHRREVRRNGDPVALAPMEFKILAFLAENAGRVMSPTQIVAAVHDYPYSHREARDAVKVYVRRIRQKLQEDGDAPDYIMNSRGFGYMLERRQRPRFASPSATGTAAGA